MTQQHTEKEFESWLKAQGFDVGNPFATSSADQERAYLAEDLFWPIEGYDRIRGDETILIFAPRGGGKSALRVRLSAISLPQRMESQILTIEYTDFSWASIKYENGENISLQDHIQELLRKTAVTLFNFCTSTTTKQNSPKKSTWIEHLPAIARSELACFIHQHAPHLLQARHVHKTLVKLNTAPRINRVDLDVALQKHTVRALLTKGNWTETATASLLADICDEQFCENNRQLTPGEQFQELVDLLQLMSIKMVHFLIDRLDEAPLLVSDHEAQVNVLEPLLAFLYLLELPRIGFKFFLSQSLQRVLTERTSIRRDRLLDRSISIIWTKEALQKVLDARLSFFSDQRVVSLRPLCTKEADDIIKNELYTMSQGSPRRMLQAVHALFRAYHNRNQDTLITANDWEEAKQTLMKVMPPIIRIELDQSKITTATGSIKLTKKEQRIFRCLVDAGGDCRTNRFISYVWETDVPEAVSSEMVGQAVRRLQAKLGESSKTPVYLLKIHGHGYRLQHYENI